MDFIQFKSSYREIVKNIKELNSSRDNSVAINDARKAIKANTDKIKHSNEVIKNSEGIIKSTEEIIEGWDKTRKQSEFERFLEEQNRFIRDAQNSIVNANQKIAQARNDINELQGYIDEWNNEDRANREKTVEKKTKMSVYLGNIRKNAENEYNKELESYTTEFESLKAQKNIEKEEVRRKYSAIIDEFYKRKSLTKEEIAVLNRKKEEEQAIDKKYLRLLKDKNNQILKLKEDYNNLVESFDKMDKNPEIGDTEIGLPTQATKTEKPEGEKPEGEQAEGEQAEGEKPEGEQAEGEKPEGEKPEGEQAEGEKPEGEQAEGEKPEGEKPEGEQAEGEKPEGEQAEGEKPEGEKPEGEQAEGEKPEGEQAEGEKPEGEQAEGEKPEGEKPEGEKPEGEQAEEEKPEGEQAEGEKPEGEKPEGEQAEEEKPEEKFNKLFQQFQEENFQGGTEQSTLPKGRIQSIDVKGNNYIFTVKYGDNIVTLDPIQKESLRDRITAIRTLRKEYGITFLKSFRINTTIFNTIIDRENNISREDLINYLKYPKMNDDESAERRGYSIIKEKSSNRFLNWIGNKLLPEGKEVTISKTEQKTTNTAHMVERVIVDERRAQEEAQRRQNDRGTLHGLDVEHPEDGEEK